MGSLISERDIAKADRQGPRNFVAAGRQHQGKAAGTSDVDYHHRTIAGMADVCLGQVRGSRGRLVGWGGGPQQSAGAGSI